MTELLTAAQMRAIEQAAIASGEVTGLELMERAGAGVVAAIMQEWPELGAGSGVTVLCGPGNNGGDGFVVARLLQAAGMRVRVLAVPTIKRSADAQAARQRWRAAGGRTRPFTNSYFRDGAPRYPRQFAEEPYADADLFVDAVLGTGARAPFGGEVGEALAYMAGRYGDSSFFQPRTVAVDLPSGLDSDSGEIPGMRRGDASSGQHTIPNARLTVTFDSPKLGHVLGIGPEVCGKVVVADIGVEPWRTMDGGFATRILKPKRHRLVNVKTQAERDTVGLSSIWSVPDCRDIMRSHPDWLRKTYGHKYRHGHAVVLAGGMGQTGAARLAARAALRVGAGLVTVAAPGSSLMECATHLTAVMTRRCNDAEGLAKMLSDTRLNAICLGPGLGLDRARELVPVALHAKGPHPKSKRAVVLDADALTAFADDPDRLFANLHSECTLTPHEGEFTRLFPDIAARLAGPQNRDVERANAATASFQATLDWRERLAAEHAPLYSRVDAARDAAARIGCTVLLKGPATVIADPKSGVAISLAAYDRAAPWLATAGSGDVLAGLITGLLARGLSPMTAAECATWLHVEAARAFGPGLIAEDLPEMIPQVFRDLGL